MGEQYRDWMRKVSARCANKNDDDLQELLGELNQELNEVPDNPEILFYISYIFIHFEKYGLAYHILRRVSEMAPNMWEVWLNLARCVLTQTGSTEALDYLQVAEQLSPSQPSVGTNSAIAFMNIGLPDLAEQAAKKVLQTHPESIKAQNTLGTSLIARRKWQEGFRLHEAVLGTKHRTRNDYGVSDWDGGTPEGQLVVYGEQGMGDEILYASLLPDLIQDIGANKVILDIDKRLVSLFAYSFPQIKTIKGDRKKTKDKPWVKDFNITDQAAIGQLAKFYRHSTESFPGTPYLEADPFAIKPMEALLVPLKKSKRPLIGLAWQGGKRGTRERRERSLKLEDFSPLIDPKSAIGLDATWIVLEYDDVIDETAIFKQAHPEIAERLVYIPAITEDKEYAKTAALVSLLDSMVAVPTTVIHLAGALGVNCQVILPEIPHWRFGFDPSWSDFPWHNSVTLHRLKSGDKWNDRLQRVSEKIRTLIQSRYEAMQAVVKADKYETAVGDITIKPPAFSEEGR